MTVVVVTARARPAKVFPGQTPHATFEAPVMLDLRKDADVVLMRQDPPFHMGYITAAHLLELVTPETLVVNDPAGRALLAGKSPAADVS